jgi:signal recognition particle receptor subunit beta
MPFIDSQTGSLTLRVVYDGPPLAGKTTSVRALAQRVRGTRGFASPAEAEGRTLYFDWLEFIGGEFGGKELRVHVISVPGQVELRHRRKFLIDQADAVVFVADTCDGHFGLALKLFSQLVPLVRAQHPPVGLVFQANKRDAPDALDIGIVRGMLSRFGRVTLVDSVATDGEGIREAFAMALRHALDRAQSLVDAGELPVSEHDFHSAGELLGRLQSLESSQVDPGVWTDDGSGALEHLNPQIHRGEPEWVPGDETLFTPDARLPSGHIWPPVDGRAIVHEASQRGVVPMRADSGDWWASTGGWRFHSTRSAIHPDLGEARNHLIEWARVHVAAAGLLSPDRALMVASAGPAQFRLWQLVRVFPSLRERLLGEDHTLTEFATKLREVAQHLMLARSELAAFGVNLRCSLWTIGENELRQPVFIGLMPSPHEVTVPELDGAELLAREFAPIVRSVSKNLSLSELAAHLQNAPSDVSYELVSLVHAVQAESA